jgi:hypothetical protein
LEARKAHTAEALMRGMIKVITDSISDLNRLRSHRW